MKSGKKTKPKVAQKVRKTIIKPGHQVRIVNSPHAAIPNGTVATVVRVRHHAHGLGKHLYELDNHRLAWWTYEEIERIEED